jgi:hypothetical protein
MIHKVGPDIGISDERERWLWSEYFAFFDGTVYVTTIELLQYILSHPGMTTAERVYMAFIAGTTCDPNGVGDSRKMDEIG